MAQTSQSAQPLTAAADEIQRLRNLLVDQTTALAGIEHDISELAASIVPLEAMQQQELAAVEAERHRLAPLLAALAQLRATPLVTAYFRGETVLDGVRAQILLAEIVPALEAQTAAFRGRLAELETRRQDLEQRRRSLTRLRATAIARSDALLEAIDRRQRLLMMALPDTLSRGPSRRAVAQTQSLGEAVRALSADEEAQLSQPESGALPVGVRLLGPGYLRPVAGEIVFGFGAANAPPARELGIAAVSAPAAGQVAFAGTFRGYGDIVIIEHGGGQHSLLIGLARLDVVVGQAVLAGEPVGLLGDDPAPTLYLELRRAGDAIDPRTGLRRG
jgi:septal ring factor EnvC (AmiA/AmiB activator)